MTEVTARATAPELRRPVQRRADASATICRTWLDASDRPKILGERPHVVVTLDLDALEGRAGRSEPTPPGR